MKICKLQLLFKIKTNKRKKTIDVGAAAATVHYGTALAFQIAGDTATKSSYSPSAFEGSPTTGTPGCVKSLKFSGSDPITEQVQVKFNQRLEI